MKLFKKYIWKVLLIVTIFIIWFCVSYFFVRVQSNIDRSMESERGNIVVGEVVK